MAGRNRRPTAGILLVEFQRELLHSQAERAGAKLIIVRAMTLESKAKECLAQRKGTGGQGAVADWGVYQRTSKDEQRARRPHFAVDTGGDIDAAVHSVVRAVRQSDRKGV